MLGLEPDADEADIDIAEPGRMKGIGDVCPGFGEDVDTDEGCCRMAKTNVLFTARRWHCG